MDVGEACPHNDPPRHSTLNLASAGQNRWAKMGKEPRYRSYTFPVRTCIGGTGSADAREWRGSKKLKMAAGVVTRVCDGGPPEEAAAEDVEACGG